MKMTDAEWTDELKILCNDLSIPGANTRIWKEECAFSFATPFSEGGLFLNLVSFQAFSRHFIGIDHDRTGNKLYLNIRFTLVPPETSDKPPVEEGKLEIKPENEANIVLKEYYLVIYPNLKADEMLPLTIVEGNNFSISSPRAGVDFAPLGTLLAVVKEVISRTDAGKEADMKMWSAEEEEDMTRPISKFSENLEQVKGVKINSDPSTWRCADSGMSDNLWLNLHDGYIGSGRRNFDGSGGTGAAMKHFDATGGKYPLCVKLGTITPDGKADIYSYDPSEDCMVKDPLLKQHLAHFGLDITKMRKTDKTLLELELDLNQRHVFSLITEDHKTLRPKSGPGFVGLKNLGNTCYMNSVIQAVFKLEAMQKRFLYGNDDETRQKRMDRFLKSGPEPQLDQEIQMIKLASALSDPESEENQNLKGQMGDEQTASGENLLGVMPKQFKDCFCSTHADFSRKDQQDSAEFFRFFLQKMEDLDEGQNVKSLGLEGLIQEEDVNPGRWFDFVMEERLECNQTKMVKYKSTTSPMLSLTVPLSLNDIRKIEEQNKAKKQKTEGGPSKEIVLPKVEFEACLNRTLGDTDESRDVITDFLSPVTGERGLAFQTSGLKTFPKYLCVQLRRYIVSEIDFTAKKLTCEIPVPEKIDLSRFRSNGIQKDEVALPDGDADDSGSSFDKMVEQLRGMGFEENLCKHALLNNNENVDVAVGWIFENMANPAYSLAPEMPEKKVETNEAKMAANVKKITDENDGEGQYRLRGFVSHMGGNTSSGHYVCHFLDDATGEWIIYNDEKVAVSQQPPLGHGYLYFFERI